MLNAYLNQTVEHKARTGTDDRGQPIYADAEIIPCRYQAKAQNVLSTTGQLIKAQHIYFTKHKVAEGDMLGDGLVVAVSVWGVLNGNAIGYKAVF